MTANTDALLAEQRQQLRRELLAQRQLIAQQLESTTPGMSSGYPRSMTMRLLIQQPDLVAKLLPGFMKPGAGTRFLKFITLLLALLKIMQSVSADKQQKRLPAP